MNWHRTPSSKMLSGFRYLPEAQVLSLKFRDSGRVFEYRDVPHDVYVSFSTAMSLGSYYNALIKGKYESREVVGEPVKNCVRKLKDSCDLEVIKKLKAGVA